MSGVETPPSPYPTPRETSTNAPMLSAWREGALALQQCSACRSIFFCPRALCPRCWSTTLSWIRSDGRGRIVSFTHIHRGLPDAFAVEAPITMAEIETTEGATLLARVICDDPGSVRSDTEVELMRLPEARRYPLPTFVLAVVRSR
jgi:uncharacterized OB-fold protein